MTQPSIHDLIDAYGQEYRPHYAELRDAFGARWNAAVEEEYFTRFLATGAAALLLKGSNGSNETEAAMYHIKCYYDSSEATPEFDEVMRNLLSEQLQSSILLKGRSESVVAQRIYAAVVGLLHVMDACRRPVVSDAGQVNTRLHAAVVSARVELSSVQEFIKNASRKTALARYLAALPIGAVLAAAVVWVVAKMHLYVGEFNDNYHLAVALTCGAIGAVISVMVRVTRGQELVVDINQSKMVTFAAGAFRPIIGAIFGAVLYVFLVGKLIPLAIPVGDSHLPVVQGGGVDPGYFFAGIAFLAGFSERWAQDTIVQSAPKVPSGLRSGKGNTAPGTRSDADEGP